MDFPLILIMDILSRLPVKSLLCYRCVSKSWKYLIDNPYFIKLQLQYSLENTTNLVLIIRGGYLYSAHFPGLNEAIVIDHSLKCGYIGTEVLGSCNGLLCLSNGESHGKNGTIIYNPVTRKSREVPASKLKIPYGYESVIYGFGYDLVNDDYKVVRVIQYSTEHPDFYDSEVKVFSLKANSWRRIRDFPREYYLSYKRGWGVYVSGCLHWMITLKPDSNGSKLIVAFDLSSEVCKAVLLPKISAGEVHLTVEVLGQFLSLLVNYPSNRSEVWVLKEYGVVESWSKLFTVSQPDSIGPFEYVRPIAYSKDGSKVLLEQDLQKLIWYDVESQSAADVKIPGMPSHPGATMLVESLVLGSRKTHMKKQYRYYSPFSFACMYVV
ncbi:F-box protein CPR30-like isoform X1 [Chenopodium quinoa]|uniref:F-box protein CPR30-like isoform X1 n=1 Tax=Chenopodium quinoa TaxID=63459 RepID=UPI000B78EFBC|nr:F-box protein CPR30-like isoform X1 [Chenopodium quinoa]XP_021719572.1 F-box protein CPR30-like isoform X1 [Chenopodium quinoa]